MMIIFVIITHQVLLVLLIKIIVQIGLIEKEHVVESKLLDMLDEIIIFVELLDQNLDQHTQ
jgi:hypothetical protein